MKGYGRTWLEAGMGEDDDGPEEPAPRPASRDRTDEATVRERDLALLRALVDEELAEHEASAFENMLDALEDEDRRYETLSPKQRQWADSRARELGVHPELRVPARDVPVGRPVETPAVLQNRPLRPPAARPRDDEHLPASSFPTNGLLCIVCMKPQHVTPGGASCENGHGGAEGVEPVAPMPSANRRRARGRS